MDAVRCRCPIPTVPEASMLRAVLIAALLSIPAAAGAAAPRAAAVPPREGDYVIRNFKFASGEALPELRLHYLALGKPARDAKGAVSNAILVLHGTGGSGRQFLAPQFADVLYGKGALLDT